MGVSEVRGKADLKMIIEEITNRHVELFNVSDPDLEKDEQVAQIKQSSQKPCALLFCQRIKSSDMFKTGSVSNQ